MSNLAMKVEQAADAMPGATAPGPDAEIVSLRRIPRITIHAFCATGDVAEALEGIGRDRRMARASLTVRNGGVEGAIAAYAAAPSPDLIVVEHTGGGELPADLDRLSSVCDLGTRVLVIGHVNDIGLYRELMKRGVSDYVQAPLGPMETIAAIAGIYADRDAEKFGRVCAFIGAAGGVGSSTIAQNTAWTMAERLESGVILADLDLAFGTAALNFDIEPAHGIAEAIQDADRLDEIMLDRLLTRSGERLGILSAPAVLDKDCDFGPEAFEKVLDLAQAAAPFVVLDMPHQWTGWTRRTLIAADEVVVTATPDMASLRNAKHMIDLLREARPNDAPPKLVLNMLNAPKRPEVKPGEFASVLGIEPAARIPFEPKLFGAASMSGKMIASTAARSRAARSIAELGQAISGRKAREARKSGLFGLGGLARKRA